MNKSFVAGICDWWITRCVCVYLLQCVDIHSISLDDSDVRRENLETFRVLLWKKLLTQNLQNLKKGKKREQGRCPGLVLCQHISLFMWLHLQYCIEGISRIWSNNQWGIGAACLYQPSKILAPNLLTGVVDVIAVADNGYGHVGELLDDVLKGIFFMVLSPRCDGTAEEINIQIILKIRRDILNWIFPLNQWCSSWRQMFVKWQCVWISKRGQYTPGYSRHNERRWSSRF